MRLSVAVALLLSLPAFSPASAQQTVMLSMLSGTGFIINNDGNMVTNAHVVKDCQAISVLTAQGEKPASLVVADAKQDLAVLKIAFISPYTAPMRWNIQDLKVGDPVIVMGYPGQEGASGHYQFKKTTVTSLVGPQGETQLIQLQSVAAHGNSGGPVLDTSGNVIGVVSAIALNYKADARGQPVGDPVSRADVAITLASLQDFLQVHGIGFYESYGRVSGYGDDTLRDNAHNFILPIRCIQGIEPR